jgi:hypothetical protein
MPTINFPSSPYDGQTYSYNGRTWYWNGYAWDVSTSTSGGGGGTSIQYLDQLEDVGIIDPYVGQALVYNGAEWVNDYIDIPNSVWENSSATTATDINGVPAGTSLVGLTPIEVLEEMLYAYQPVVLSAFSIGLSSTFEIGDTAGGGSATATWSATNSSNVVTNGMGITYSGVAAGTLVTSQPYSAGSGLSIAHSSYSTSTVGGTLTFTLSADQEQGANATRTTSSRWWSRMHYGKSTNASLTTFMGGTLSGGSNSLISSSSFPASSLSLSAVNGYIYIFVHNDYSIASFAIGATDVSSTFSMVGTQSITNAYSATATYKVYRSTNQLNGDFTLSVS